MQIELKNLTHYTRLSQETNAFAADIWIDGRYAGTAENQGHGGPDNYRIPDKDLCRRFEEYCKSLPPREAYGKQLPMDAEFLIGLLVEEDLQRRELQKSCKKRTLFRLKDQTYKEGEYNTIGQPWTPALDAALVARYGDNLLEVVNRQFQAEPAAPAKAKPRKAKAGKRP